MLLSVIAAPYGCNPGTANQRPLSQPPTQEPTDSNKQTTPKTSAPSVHTNHSGDTTIIQENIEPNNNGDDGNKIELKHTNHIRSIKKNKIEPEKNGSTVQQSDDDEIEPEKNDSTVQSDEKDDEIKPAKGEEKNKPGFFKRLLKRKKKKDK
ncbi:hypothetical protein [Cardinium endosymbiont of Culicoides punctatus]|uniref:hypothetical protein n=1 Tax=Cardinium endosymbiont of Culicoides punctatus TaxID=2304601 RepID=UPI001058E15B|nr:hypothetical protein [Cardinium endosymbiont of Culicoides punctatus]